MPSTKPTRKPYRPRLTIKPLNMRDDWKILGAAHSALIALEAGVYGEDQQYGLVVFADLCRRCATPGSAEAIQAKSLINTLLDVQMRHNQTGHLRVSKIETASIQAAGAVLTGWLRNQPNRTILNASIKGLAEFERLGGIPMRVSA